MSHSGFRKLKDDTFGKKVFTIGGKVNICFKCGTKLNVGNYRFLKGYNYCCKCYKNLTGLENQFNLVNFIEFTYENANKNYGHLVNLNDIGNSVGTTDNITCFEIIPINKGATYKNKKDTG